MGGSDEFSKSVDMGIKLSKRIYYGKDDDDDDIGSTTFAPKPAVMTKTLSHCSSSMSSAHHGGGQLPADRHRPTGLMVYAVITEPDVVDNPDIRSYQPHVHGRCNPPALIPLHMHGISMNVDCYLDTAFVMVSGAWRVHCVTASASCDCRIAIPMGEQQGSIQGIDVETTKRSYFTKFVTLEDERDTEGVTKGKDAFMMNPNTYTLKVPQVEGGSMIQIKVRWSQKLLYQGNHEFCLNLPFTFPYYVIPLQKKIPKRQKLVVNVHSGNESMITCRFASHPLKEVRQQAGEASFSYEAEVVRWSTRDFAFTYSVCSNEIFGGLLLQRPFLYDYDQRDMFCFYLFPGTNSVKKHFKREVVYLVDISGSMRAAPLEKSKDAITTSLSKLNEGDTFNIIAFNNEVRSFSSSLQLATEETITGATEWMWENLAAEGGTNLMCPIKQAIDMVGKIGESIPLIFLITDGTVENERDVFSMVKCSLVDGSMSSPRISTFGIGSYCNHHFLKMLAHIGRGYYDAAYEIGSIDDRLPRLLDNALSPMLINLTLDALEKLKSYELYPSRIPDLVYGRPLIVSGRFHGKFPECVKVRGIIGDQSSYVTDIKVRKRCDINLEKICSRREVDILTAQAWLDQNTHLEEKVVKMSLQRGIPSEYTCMIVAHNDKVKSILNSFLGDEKSSKSINQKAIYMRQICVGFGNLKATFANVPPGIEDEKLTRAATIVMNAASSFYGVVASSGCWRCLSELKNSQCFLAIAQLCTAFACLEFLDCCCDLCDSCMDLCQ